MCVQQQVLGLQVSVDDAALVAELHRREDLPELPASVGLTQPPTAGQVIYRSDSETFIHPGGNYLHYD